MLGHTTAKAPRTSNELFPSATQHIRKNPQKKRELYILAQDQIFNPSCEGKKNKGTEATEYKES